MQTAARAASSTASARSRSPNGSLPLVRENWARPTTVSWATIGTASVDWSMRRARLRCRPAGDDCGPGGAQGVGAGRVERVAVDRADLDGLGDAAVAAADAPKATAVGDGAGEGDPAQFGAAVGESGRGLVAGEQPLVEVDGGQVAEPRDGDVQQFAGGGLQVEGVADAGARPRSAGRGCAVRRAASGRRARRPVTSVASPATPMGRPEPLCTPVEDDGPVAALGGAGHGPTSGMSVSDSPVSRTWRRAAASRSASPRGSR